MIQLDKTSKFLLLALVLGIWGLALRPIFYSDAAQAQKISPPFPQSAKASQLWFEGDYLYLYQGGKLFKYGFEGKMKRHKSLVEKGLIQETEVANDKPILQATYDLTKSAPGE